jgi:hypothetical protein
VPEPPDKPPRHLTVVEEQLDGPPAKRSDAPKPAADDRLALLVQQLRELANTDIGIEQSVAIGRLVIEHLYGGELAAWRDRGPKAHSLRALARRAKLPISSSALYRSIALYELSEVLGGLEPWVRAGLGISHLRLVLGLDVDDQRGLLDRAVTHAWTVAELEREAAGARRRAPKRASRGGRPRTPRFMKCLQHLRKIAESPEDMFGDLDAVRDMDSAQRREIHETLAVVRARCDQLERRIAEELKSP